MQDCELLDGPTESKINGAEGEIWTREHLRDYPFALYMQILGPQPSAFGLAWQPPHMYEFS